TVDFIVLMFISLVTLGALALLWLRGTDDSRSFDLPAIVPAFFLAVTAIVLMTDPRNQAIGGVSYGALLIFAMLLVAFYRPKGLPLVHAAGIATVLVHVRAALTGTFDLQLPGGGTLTLDGFSISPFAATLRPAGIVLAIIFLVDGFWSGWRSVGH